MIEEREEVDVKARIWYVLHVKPRTEKKAFERLTRLGVFRHLPLLKKVTKVQRRKVTRFLPLFPGYVFTRLNADERRSVLKSQLVVRTIEVRQPRQMIHQLRQIAHAGRLPSDICEAVAFSVGEHVRVKSGPFRGIDGYVRREGQRTMLVLELSILGRAVEVSISPDDLERL